MSLKCYSLGNVLDTSSLRKEQDVERVLKQGCAPAQRGLLRASGRAALSCSTALGEACLLTVLFFSKSFILPFDCLLFLGFAELLSVACIRGVR